MADYLRPLIEFASSVIPTSQLASTPIYLLATAGMRLLPPHQQSAVLTSACLFLRSYPFSLPDCSEQVRIISGEEEGLYGWIAVNYLMDGFDSHEHASTSSSTYGFLDMGGASTQIAFEPSESERIKHSDNLLEVKLRLLSGKEVRHPVFVTTWLGFGTNQARDRYIDQEIKAHLRASDLSHTPHELAHPLTEKHNVIVDDPCLPKSLMLSDPRHSGYTLRGTGDFAQCVHRTGPLLNKEVECLDQPCLFNGVHVPAIDFSVNHFIGISEYWYSTQDVWSMGGMYDFVEFEKNALKYCGREWDSIMDEHKKGGGWKEEVELSRLETQCFKAAWIINILHEGIGIPRIIDHGGKGDGEKGKKVGGELAGEKGWTETVEKGRKPSFQSLNKVGEVSVSWTLGKMVLEVSRGAGGTSELSKSLAAKEGYNTWSDRLPSTIADLSPPTPILFLPVIAIAVLVYFFFRSTSTSAAGRFQRRNGFDLVSQEDTFSSGDSTTPSSTSPYASNRRPLNGLAKSIAPFRWSLFRLSTVVRSWSKPRPTSLLPLTHTNTSRSTADIVRPRPRHPNASSSFLRSTSGSAPSSTPSTLGTTTTTSAYYLDAPDVSDRLATIATQGRSSSSSGGAHLSRSTSSTTPITTPVLSRPTTPRTNTTIGIGELKKLTRSREGSFGNKEDAREEEIDTPGKRGKEYGALGLGAGKR